MLVAVRNLDPDKFTDVDFACVFDDHDAIDLRRIGHAARGSGAVCVDMIDKHGDFPSDLALELVGADGRLFLHEAFQAFLFYVFGDMVVQGIGGKADQAGGDDH